MCCESIQVSTEDKDLIREEIKRQAAYYAKKESESDRQVTVEALREVEGLEGCPVARELRSDLLRRLGYRVQVLPGAFAYEVGGGQGAAPCPPRKCRTCADGHDTRRDAAVADRVAWVEAALEEWDGADGSGD